MRCMGPQLACLINWIGTTKVKFVDSSPIFFFFFFLVIDSSPILHEKELINVGNADLGYSISMNYQIGHHMPYLRKCVECLEVT